MRSILYAVGIICGALFLTTIGIYASDTLRGINSDRGTTQSLCPRGMTAILRENSTLCVDMYEASPSEDCFVSQPSHALETEKNAQQENCFARSEVGHMPWTFVTLSQAQRLCAQAGKRLPSNDEWFEIAMGTREESCNSNGNSVRATEESLCVSPSGVYDMVGNVWEWVDGTVTEGSFEGRSLPSSGYIQSADANGISIETHISEPSDLYGKDYIWTKQEGVFGMVRGGFYAGGDDSGLYAINASVPVQSASLGIGFRCVMSL